MKAIARTALSSGAVAELARKSALVASASDSVGESDRLWRSFRTAASREVREALRGMASGRERCMYCEDSHGNAIDHFRPRRWYPEETFNWANLLWACADCNSNFKRDQFPTGPGGAPLLIDPTTDDPTQHLALAPRTGFFVPLDEKGRWSIDVFALNRQVCADGRQDLWVVLEVLAVEFDNALLAGDGVTAARCREAIRRVSFSGVGDYMERYATLAGAASIMSPRAIDVLQRHPGLLTQ